MSDKTLEELPIRRLYALAKKQHLRVSLKIDGEIGKTYLDTLDVWEGRPFAVGSRLIGRASVVGQTLDEAATGLIGELG